MKPGLSLNGYGKANTMTTICEMCSRATADQCWLMRLKNVSEGLRRMGIGEGDYITHKADRHMILYKINRCPHFKAKPLVRGRGKDDNTVFNLPVY